MTGNSWRAELTCRGLAESRGRPGGLVLRLWPSVLFSFALCVGPSSAQSPAPCRLPATPDEQALVTTATSMLASLEALLARVKARRLDLERKLRIPDASDAMYADYHDVSLQEEELQRRLLEFRRLLAAWCQDSSRKAQ